MNALRQSFPEPILPVPQTPRLRLVRPPHDVSAAVLDRFATERASQEEKQAVVRHLLAGCRECQAHLRTHWGIGRTAAEGAYDPAFHRSLKRLAELQAAAK